VGGNASLGQKTPSTIVPLPLFSHRRAGSNRIDHHPRTRKKIVDLLATSVVGRSTNSTEECRESKRIARSKTTCVGRSRRHCAGMRARQSGPDSRPTLDRSVLLRKVIKELNYTIGVTTSGQNPDSPAIPRLFDTLCRTFLVPPESIAKFFYCLPKKKSPNEQILADSISCGPLTASKPHKHTPGLQKHSCVLSDSMIGSKVSNDPLRINAPPAMSVIEPSGRTFDFEIGSDSAMVNLSIDVFHYSDASPSPTEFAHH